MAKNQRADSANRTKVIPAPGSEKSQRRDKKPPTVRREILFPLEPSTIGDERIERAIDAVMSRKKQR